jgi:hypothetical protein
MALRLEAETLNTQSDHGALAAALQRLQATLLDISALTQEITDRLWVDYLLAGAPYGETPSGLHTWVRRMLPARRRGPSA